MMQMSTEVLASNLGTPRSSVSISTTDSGRRSSLRQVLHEKELPSPQSPGTRLTRKRVASLLAHSPNDPRIEDLALNSAGLHHRASSISGATREQVCLCQPDPKIPRPRNAFILYRQHYQAQVVAQNPGLANPEISKIIGEQWREQPPEIKSDWKKLAEEEKQRHQRQYPGYRYQPRRAGKPNGIRPSIAGDEPGRCPKCNGLYISTPGTPLTPFTPGFAAGPHRDDRLLPPFTPAALSRPAELDRPSYPSHAMPHPRMEPPRTAPLFQQLRRPQYPPPPGGPKTHHERQEDMDLLSPGSGGPKRRRFNEENQRAYVSNSPVSFSAPGQQFGREGRGGPQPQPTSANYCGRQQLPGPGMITRQGPMGPPALNSPTHPQVRGQYPPPRTSTFSEDRESLRLPPLQTQIANPPQSKARLDPRVDIRESQAKSVEAMVMTIPYVNKIKVLHKISPSLAPPGPTSPAQEIRGAVIAVEGADNALLAEVGSFILEHLSNDHSFAIKTWEGSSSFRMPTSGSRKASDGVVPTPEDKAAKDAASRASSRTSSVSIASVIGKDAEEKEKDPFVEYLSVISEWHRKSQEMIRYITVAPSTSSPRGGKDSSDPTPESHRRERVKVLPVALVPSGFSLTTSDNFALQIPINDSYAPVDHWQWMATLWRGIVGPDLTIYVARCGREEMNQAGGVEVRVECKAIIVRIGEGAKKDEKTGRWMDASVSRRLGFEVTEYVRNNPSGFLSSLRSA